MRLTGNNRNHDREGRLEIYINTQWYEICDEQFTKEQADAACQYLGYPKRYMNITNTKTKNVCVWANTPATFY